MYPNQPTFKIILCGSQGAGKTSLINRYISGTFKPDYYSTIGIDFKLHSLSLSPSQRVKLQLWDTAGQQRFQSLTSIHFKGAHSVIVVVDISNKESIKSGRHYLEQAIEEFRIGREFVYLVANKCDVECMRELGEQEIKELGEEFGVKIGNCSAKNGEGVGKVFEEIVGRLMGMETVGKQKQGNEKEVELKQQQGVMKKCEC